jgi:integrase
VDILKISNDVAPVKRSGLYPRRAAQDHARFWDYRQSARRLPLPRASVAAVARIWAATLRTYAEPSIGKLLVRDIRAAHVIGVLEPIWTTKTETATRVRSRIELVLDYAAARGHREGLNPARWKGNLDAALPNASKVAPVRHHAAVEVKEVGSFMKRLRSQGGVGARALEFAVLTAARSGEVRGAIWSEVVLKGALWTIPAARMKSGREHRVPLSKPAVKLLRSLPGDRLPCFPECAVRFPT